MVIGDDITVCRQNEAGAGSGGGSLISPVVRGNGSGDTDCGAHIGRIDLGRGHLFTGSYLHHIDGCGLPDALQNGSGVLLRERKFRCGGFCRRGFCRQRFRFFRSDLLPEQKAARAEQAAQQGAAQRQRRDLQSCSLFSGFLFLFRFRNICLLPTGNRRFCRDLRRNDRLVPLLLFALHRFKTGFVHRCFSFLQGCCPFCFMALFYREKLKHSLMNRERFMNFLFPQNQRNRSCFRLTPPHFMIEWTQDPKFASLCQKEKWK